jgi:hypothetical protein
MLAAGAALLALPALQAAVSISPVTAAQAPPASVSPERLVSLTRIRQELERQSHPLAADVPQTIQPTFRAVVQGQRIQAIFDALDFNGGPVPPGGLYAFEQRRLLGDPWAGQPLIQVNVLPVVKAAYHAISRARRDHAERAAHEEVRRALIEFCEMDSNCSSR